MIKPKYILKTCLIFIIIVSCGVHKYKNQTKPCDCPENGEKSKKKKHTEYKININENLKYKTANIFFV